MDTKDPKSGRPKKRSKPDFRFDPKDLHAEDGLADLLPSEDTAARLHGMRSLLGRPVRLQDL